MPFPARDPNAPPKPKAVWGKNKSRKYAVCYTSRKSGSAAEETFAWGEFRGQHARGLHNAVVRQLREQTGKTELRASDVLIVEAHLMPPRTSLDQYLVSIGVQDEDNEEE